MTFRFSPSEKILLLLVALLVILSALYMFLGRYPFVAAYFLATIGIHSWTDFVLHIIFG